MAFSHNEMMANHAMYNRISTDEMWNRYRFNSSNPVNSTSSFFNMDSEANFKKNLSIPNKRKLLEEYNWIDTKITYRFNNYGFRSPDDYTMENIQGQPIFIGGSVTDAAGGNIEDSWAYVLNSTLNSNIFFNLSQSGSGSDSVYRLLKAWAPISHPTDIYWAPTPEPRREFIMDESKSTVVASWTSDPDMIRVLMHISHLHEIDLHTIRMYDAIRMVANDLGANLYIPSELAIRTADIANAGRMARDLMHPSAVWHKTLADNIDKWLKIN